MSGWSSFKEEQNHFNSWRSFLNEEFYAAGIDSEEMEDSLLNWLKPLVGKEINDDHLAQILFVLKNYAKEEDILLEALGGPTGPNKKFSFEATNHLNNLIDSFDLKTQARKKLEKTINGWANTNQIQFTAAAPSAPATPSTPTPTPADPEPEEVNVEPEVVDDAPTDEREEVLRVAVQAELIGLEDAESEEEMQRFLGFFKAEKGTLDKIDLLLTAGSIIPGGIGCTVGLTNSAYNAARAEFAWAVFDLIFSIPPICGSGAGEAASAGKGVFKVLAKPAAKVGGKVSKATAKALRAVEKALAKVLPDASQETLQALAKKYAQVLQEAVKSKKTEKQTAAVLTLMPTEVLEGILTVLDTTAQDVAPDVTEVLTNIGEKFGLDLEDEAQEQIVDLLIILMGKAGVIDDDKEASMLQTLESIREQVAGFAADQPGRVREFIGSLDAEARSADVKARTDAYLDDFRARRAAAAAEDEDTTTTTEPIAAESIEQRVQRLYEEKFSKLTKTFTK